MNCITANKIKRIFGRENAYDPKQYMLGVPGVLMWIAILFVAFVVAGYLLFGLDRLHKKT